MPFIVFYDKQIDPYNHTAHEILMKDISVILPNFPKDRKDKYNLIISNKLYWFGILSISIYLHNKRQKALHKAFMAMEDKVNLK